MIGTATFHNTRRIPLNVALLREQIVPLGLYNPEYCVLDTAIHGMISHK